MTRKSQSLHKDTLFVGLTRPAMVLGVPYIGFVIEVIGASVFFINSPSLLSMLGVLPVHGVMYLIGAHDPGVFESIYMWTKTYGRCRNMRFWGGASFSPLPMRKWRM